MYDEYIAAVIGYVLELISRSYVLSCYSNEA